MKTIGYRLLRWGARHDLLWIQDDLNDHRPRAQFRLQFSPETDDGATADYVSFESGNNSFGTGNVPQLIITYTP